VQKQFDEAKRKYNQHVLAVWIYQVRGLPGQMTIYQVRGFPGQITIYQVRGLPGQMMIILSKGTSWPDENHIMNKKY